MKANLTQKEINDAYTEYEKYWAKIESLAKQENDAAKELSFLGYIFSMFNGKSPYRKENAEKFKYWFQRLVEIKTNLEIDCTFEQKQLKSLTYR